jgi:hypothetical protein
MDSIFTTRPTKNRRLHPLRHNNLGSRGTKTSGEERLKTLDGFIPGCPPTPAMLIGAPSVTQMHFATSVGCLEAKPARAIRINVLRLFSYAIRNE